MNKFKRRHGFKKSYGKKHKSRKGFGKRVRSYGSSRGGIRL